MFSEWGFGALAKMSSEIPDSTPSWLDFLYHNYPINMQNAKNNNLISEWPKTPSILHGTASQYRRIVITENAFYFSSILFSPEMCTSTGFRALAMQALAVAPGASWFPCSGAGSYLRDTQLIPSTRSWKWNNADFQHIENNKRSKVANSTVDAGWGKNP